MVVDKEIIDKVIAALMSAVSNKILERGMKHEWELLDKRMLKRRQEMKSRFMAERRKNEVEQVIRRMVQ